MFVHNMCVLDYSAIDDLTKAVHEVISQEVMSLKPVAFRDIVVDIDSILVERKSTILIKVSQGHLVNFSN